MKDGINQEVFLDYVHYILTTRHGRLIDAEF